MDSSSDEECRVCLCLRPSWGQKLANPRVFAFCYCLLTIVQSISWVYVVSVLTSVENHFQLPSESFGIVMTVGEAVNVVTGLLAGLFLDASSHRPRALAIALCIYAVGAYLFTLPYYYYGSPIPLDANSTAAERNTTVLCIAANVSVNETINGNSDEEKCSVQLKAPTEDVTAVVAMFIAAFTIVSMGSCLIHIVGAPFIDDNVRNKESPMYLAVTYSVRTLGPILGAFLGTLCLTIYVDPTVEPWFDNHDRRWVGAWWIGYITMGTLAVICAFIIAQFPSRLPTMDKTPAMEMLQMESMNRNYENKSLLKIKFSTMKSNLKGVLTNVLLWYRILSETFTWFGLEGYSMFLPKFLEHQFRMTASQASLATGTALVSPSMVGNLIVGYFIQRLEPTARQLAATLVFSKSTETL